MGGIHKSRKDCHISVEIRPHSEIYVGTDWGWNMTITEITQLLANGGTLAVLMYFMFVKSEAQTQAINNLTTAVEKLNILLQKEENKNEN